jgi:hypothetical protein
MPTPQPAPQPQPAPSPIRLRHVAAVLRVKRFAEYDLWRRARAAARAGDTFQAARLERAADVKATEARRLRYYVVRVLRRGGRLRVPRRARPDRPYTVRLV